MLPLPLGQAIRHHGKDGILVAIHGTQTPGTCGTMSGVMAYGGSAEFDVVWSDGTESKKVPESLVRTSKAWEIVEGVVGTAEDIATAVQFHDTQSAVRWGEQSKAATTATSKRETDIARFLAEHPTLKTTDGPSGSSHALGAQNLKTQLVAQFPGVKFSVRSSSFAGGDSIDVSWTDGPPVAEVDTLCSGYREGRFDGMTDSYNNASDSAWSDTFGGAKYVQTSRDISDALRFSAASAICRKLGIEFKSYDQKPYPDETDDLAHHTRLCLHAVAIPGGCTEVTEVRSNTGLAFSKARFEPCFAAAVAPADAVADRRSAPKTETKVRTQVKRKATLSAIVDDINARNAPPGGWDESDKVPEAVKAVESGKQESRKEAPPTVAVPTPWPSASSPRRLPASADPALMAALKKVPATMLGYLAKQAGLPDGVSDGYHRSFTLWCQTAPPGNPKTDWRQAWAAFVAAIIPPAPIAPAPAPAPKPHPLPHRDSVLPDAVMNKSFKAEYLVEGKWATNALRFASKEEADASVSELMSRWYVPEEGRAAESGDPVSHKFDFVAHRNVPVAEAAPDVKAEVADRPANTIEALKRLFPVGLAKELLRLPGECICFPMGDHNVELRKRVLGWLLGRTVTRKESGATAIRDALVTYFGVDTYDCIASTEGKVERLLRDIAGEPEPGPIAYVGAAMADAFGMRGLPNTRISDKPPFGGTDPERQFAFCGKPFRVAIGRIAEAAGMDALAVHALWLDYANRCDEEDECPQLTQFVVGYSEKLGGDGTALFVAIAGELESHIPEVFAKATAPATAPAEDFNEGDWVAFTNSHGIPCVGKVERAWTVFSGGANRTEYFLVDAGGNVMTGADYTKPITLTAAPAEEEEDAEPSVIAFPVAEIPLVPMPPMPPVAAPVVGLGWLRRMRPM